MSRNYYCPLLGKEIDEGRCLDINYELIKAKKEEQIKDIKKVLKKTEEDVSSTCNACSNYPL